MNEALQYFYYFISSCITFCFDNMLIAAGVSFGWVVVSVIVMGMLVRSVLNLPRGVNIRHPSTTTFYDRNGNMTGFSVRRRGR